MSNNSDNYGEYFWMINLTDGDTYMCYADRVEITAHGDLVTWADTRKGPEDEVGKTQIPREQSIPTLGFAAGTWLSFAAASCLDGHRVAVDAVNGEWL